jgi:hypothetical protein
LPQIRLNAPENYGFGRRDDERSRLVVNLWHFRKIDGAGGGDRTHTRLSSDGIFNPQALRIEANKRSRMKVFYDRLADWICQKAKDENLSLEEALVEENAHVPIFAVVKNGRVIE